jgi:hypothetical protein
MKRFVLLLATVALSLPAGCGGGRTPAGDGTVRDEEEPTPAVDLAALEHADVDAPADQSPAAALSQRLAAIVAAAAGRTALLDDPALLRATQLSSARAVAESEGDAAGSGSAADRAWEVKFPRGNTIQIYARILDYFGIELGVVQPDGTIVYAARLSKAKPDVHRGLASQERRYYLTWSRGNLADADQQLLARAGVDSRDKVVLKFLRPEMESFLAEMEKSYAGGQANRIEKTRFSVRRTQNGYDIFVLEQTYK